MNYAFAASDFASGIDAGELHREILTEFSNFLGTVRNASNVELRFAAELSAAELQQLHVIVDNHAAVSFTSTASGALTRVLQVARVSPNTNQYAEIAREPWSASFGGAARRARIVFATRIADAALEFRILTDREFSVASDTSERGVLEIALPPRDYTGDIVLELRRVGYGRRPHLLNLYLEFIN